MAETPELEPFDFGLLPKGCDCLDSIHTGAHWIYHDRLWFKMNLEILKAGKFNALCRQAFLREESTRLREKLIQMRRHVWEEKRPCRFPEGYRESDYEKQALEVVRGWDDAHR